MTCPLKINIKKDYKDINKSFYKTNGKKEIFLKKLKI